MQRILRAATFFTMTATLISCVYSPTVTYADTLEVSHLIKNRRDIHKPVERVEMLAPDRAEIDSGHMDLALSPQYWTAFRVHRVAGRWVVDESSIMDMESVILKPSEYPGGLTRANE